MGNKLGRRRQVVDEKYTRPQGLYQHRDVDHKKLRKLILDSKLAPCYPGDDECAFDLEECPICFMYYPSLNRSRCCMKGICTAFNMSICFGCVFFVRVLSADETASFYLSNTVSFICNKCPFCKTSNYAVEYRGMRSKEEKGMEQVEEQRVIEAKIRMRRQELQDEEERMHRRLGRSSSSRIMTHGEVGYRHASSGSLAVSSFSFPGEGEEIISSQDSHDAPTIRQPLLSRLNRENEFDLDLEDIMVMEAIWLSIQENGNRRNPAHGDAAPSEPFVTGDRYVTPGMVPLAETSSPSGGLACAIAALAERQQVDRESSTNDNGNMSAFDTLPDSSRLPNGEEQAEDNYPPESWIEVSPDSGRTVPRDEGEWGIDHGSVVAEAGTSYASSDATGEVGVTLPDSIGDHFQPNITGPILPESFEEQMMLAMAVSLAEARGRTSAQGVGWI
ncbi:hypothetical protein HHK36_004942 [Tetracentron sinense]|uniref:RING-type domain-containing protein n=1 Tax=Tetracentron sinense TaxID=13715 RepID=A0A835DLW4_TETSI|nr:hypothetical protein HHK36_004942 [Tetracentron sinense]